jgi:hypothetical protein
MPFFKTTKNIFTPWEDELFSENWMDTNKPYTPPTKIWDYKRPLKIEDIDIWEVVYEQGGGVGIYAAWEPYAEFYLLRTGWKEELSGKGIETYYGEKSQGKVIKRCRELGIPLAINKLYVDPGDMWLFSNIEVH